MLGLLSPLFWFYSLYFIVASLLAFYIPGSFFVSKLKLDKFKEFILSIVVGIVLWGWQGFVLGYAELRLVSYLYIAVFFLFWLFKGRYRVFDISFRKIRSIDSIVLILIILGVFAQSSAIWFTGLKISSGLYFCCGSVQDNVLFLAITDEISKRFPPFEPGMYGTTMQNYHYWGSLVISELVRVFKLPLISTSYQFMPILVSFLLGLSAMVFAQSLNIGKVFVRWLVFFLYLGADFVWIIAGVFRGKSFFDMSPLESGPQFLENLPRAFAVVALFAMMSLLLLWIKKKNLYIGILIAVICASLLGFKVYVGIFALCGFAALALYLFLKKEFKMLIPIALAFTLSALVYLPVNNNAGGLFFTGLWRFENFVVQPGLNLQRLELARVIYAEHNNILRVIQYELIYIFLFVVSIFGTKLLGIFQSRKSLTIFPIQLNLFLIPAIIISFIAGSFFSQTSGGSNTFNFLVSIFILGSIYTALACYYWAQKLPKAIKYLIVVIIILLTVPRSINQTYTNLKNIYSQKGHIIGNQELEALNFLSRKEPSFILTDPELKLDAQSPYISFLSGQKMYLSGIGDELEAHGIDFSDRLEVRDAIFRSPNPGLVASLLVKNEIDYIYLYSYNNIYSTDSAKFLPKVFDNEKIKILRVDTKKAENYIQYKHQ